MNIIDIITVGWIILGIITVPVIVRMIVSKAIKKRIAPEFAGKGWAIDKYKWIGPIGTGDFNENQFCIASFFSSRGTLFMSFYVNIYYTNGTLKKRLTARIETLFLFVKKVSYSKGF